MKYNESENLITLYKPEEVAEILQIGLNTTYDLLHTGKIKGLKVGRIWKIPKMAIEEYILSECKLK